MAFLFREGYDLEIQVPKSNKVYRITEIVWEQNTQKCKSDFGVLACPGTCFSHVFSCKVDKISGSLLAYQAGNGLVVIGK